MAQAHLPFFAAHFAGFENGENVLFHRELAENRRLLREVSDAQARPPMHRPAGDGLPVKLDQSFVGAHQTYQHVERRRLSSAVRPQQCDHFTRRNVNRNSVDHAALAVLFDQSLSCEQAHVDRGRR